MNFITTRHFDSMDKETLFFFKCLMCANSQEGKINFKKKKKARKKPSRN